MAYLLLPFAALAALAGVGVHPVAEMLARVVRRRGPAGRSPVGEGGDRWRPAYYVALLLLLLPWPLIQ